MSGAALAFSFDLTAGHIVRGCLEGVFAFGQVYVLISRCTLLYYTDTMFVLEWLRAVGQV